MSWKVTATVQVELSVDTFGPGEALLVGEEMARSIIADGAYEMHTRAEWNERETN